MFRRCFLTAAAAVTIALVAPSTSRAQFTVLATGTSVPIAGSSISVNDSTSGVTNPGGVPTVVQTVGSSGSIAVNGGNPGVFNQSGNPGFLGVAFNQVAIGGGNINATGSNVIGLGLNPITGAGVTTYVNAPTTAPAGVYVGAGMTQSQFPTSAGVTTSTNVVVWNDTSVTETISLVVTGTFTEPTGAGALLSVLNTVTDNAFYSGTSATPGSGNGAIDNLNFVGIGNGGLGGTSGSSTPINIGGPNPQALGPFSFTFVNGTTGSYTLSEHITLTLAAGDSVEFQASMGDQLVFAPAPSGLVMGLAGVPFLGLGLLRRRLGRAVPTVA